MFVQFKRLTWKASLLATVVSMLAFTIAFAASGDLDTTFDGDGLVTSYIVPSNPGRSDNARGVAIQTDGKIVVAGFSDISSTTTSDFALTRHNTDGSLDITFSGDGRLLTNFGGIDRAFDVTVQANGKIVVAGVTCNATSGLCDAALARYNTNGTLDTTFSADGKKKTDFGGGDNGANSVAIQSNGKIVAGGYMHNGTNQDFAIYRYNANGALDTTFSGDGMVNIGFVAGQHDFSVDLVIQSDGKIVVAGDTWDASESNFNFAVARLNANGSLDTTFSGDGKQVTNFGPFDVTRSVRLQPDGKIVVAGNKFVNTNAFALARYNVDGSLDTTFNGTGKKAFTVLTNGFAWSLEDMLIQSDGKIVTLGWVFNGSDSDFALLRLNSGGSIDTTFSGDGKVTIDFGGTEVGTALAVQPVDGKYVLAGYTYDGTQHDFALARMLP